MKFHIKVRHALSDLYEPSGFRVTVEASSPGEAMDEGLRICLAAFPRHKTYGYTYRRASKREQPKYVRRRDYEVHVLYFPSPGKHVKIYSWSNCASPEEAAAAAKRQFLLDHPGAQFISAEARTR